MKKESLISRLFKQMLVLGILLFVSANSAMAGEQAYYDYYANLSAYPSGAGSVYVDMEANDDCILTDAMDEPLSDMKTPAENIEVKFIYNGFNSQSFPAVATPNEGWIFAGYSACTKDVDGTHLFNDKIISRAEKSDISMNSKISDKDLSTAQSNFPISPDTTFYALFTHVAVDVCTGQDSLGTAKISKVCNDINDEVTLTATPKNAEHTQFDYWIKKETGEKITTNPLTLIVADTAHYQAHFTSDLAQTINFPEEGGYAMIYSDKAFMVPSNASICNFNYSTSDSLRYNTDKKIFYQEPFISGYQGYAHEPYIMQGYGEVTLFLTDESENSNSANLLAWSGENEINISELPVTKHYYSVNFDKQQFELLPKNAKVPAKTIYLALPNERYEVYEVTEAPAIIYWNNPDPSTGIVSVQQNVAKAAPKGIYNIQGQKVAKMTGNGLYIVNGKKVINLAK